MAKPIADLGDQAARRRLHDALRDPQSVTRTLSDVRSWLPPRLYQEAVRWMLRNKDLKDRLYVSRFPTKLGTLYRYTPPRPISPAREIRWVRFFLLEHAERLNDFVILERQVETQLLHEDYDGALSL